jgi:hypothetical protein
MSGEADLPGSKNARDAGLYATCAGVVPSLPRSTNPAKEYVMSCLPHLVREGIAEWDVRGNGVIELRFKTGETYLLGKDVVTRTA